MYERIAITMMIAIFRDSPFLNKSVIMGQETMDSSLLASSLSGNCRNHFLPLETCGHRRKSRIHHASGPR
jgi:hypothetical protein